MCDLLLARVPHYLYLPYLLFRRVNRARCRH